MEKKKDHFTSVFSKRYAPRNSMAAQQAPKTAMSTAGERALVPIKLYLKPSTP
jgi:hypothetical protein